MAPPHLHPRSRMTSSLFATTVFASFFVVVLPHILPCPAPRVTLSDGTMAVVAEDGTVIQPQRRRRRRHIRGDVAETSPDQLESSTKCAAVTTAPAPAEVQRGEDGMARFAMVSAGGDEASATSSSSPGAVADTYTEAREARRTTRACPVPKPGGVVGELLGFKRSEDREQPPARQPQAQVQAQHLPLEK